MARKQPAPARLTLRVLARLLTYPDAELRAHIPDLLSALLQEQALDPARLHELRALCQQLTHMDRYAAEERYVETFDRGRQCSLLLFEHVHGDSRERGEALVDLMKTYESAGLQFAANELPDYLPAVLEFASTQEPALARAFLGETAHILNALFTALVDRGSPYASVVAAVLEVAGEAPQRVEIEPEPDLDESWAEPPAFDGMQMAGQSQPGQRRHKKAPEIRYVQDEPSPTQTPEGAAS
ncbi:MAG: nitrate reductase molybdenum cofactor assembly chaperone [Ottowia sp.]|nr:nitrate reductase molybdenum cofactor assembly chaperone [Ottowia sp.]